MLVHLKRCIQSVWQKSKDRMQKMWREQKMNCCGGGSHNEHQEQSAPSGKSWLFWLMSLIILGTLLISIFR